jgi:hypothetical protein
LRGLSDLQNDDGELMSLRRFALMLFYSFGAALALIGCLSPGATTCADGRVCPANSRCDVQNHRCVTTPEDVACANLAEGDACTLNDAPGSCRGGACVAHYCGDDRRTENELCDGSDLGGKKCTDLGFYGQTSGLKCAADCTFDESGCSGKCGDGKINGTEVCDGMDLGGVDCKKMGFYETAGLSCSSDCTFDVSQCHGYCGDGLTNGTTEQCDGAPPAGKTCLDYGFDRGLLGCTDLCQTATDGCEKIGWQLVATRDIPGQMAGPGGYMGIWGSSTKDVYVVGQNVVHWDGNAWATVKDVPPDPVTPGWSGVWGAGGNNVWIANPFQVGHWNGTKWTITNTPAAPVGQPFKGFSPRLWGSGPSDVYLYGAATLMHWDGSRWSDARPDSDPTVVFSQMSGSGPKDVYAVDQTRVWHWEGSLWEIVAIGEGDQISAIWSSSPTDAYAFSSASNYHWDGMTWSVMPRVPGVPESIDGGPSVWSDGADDIFVVSRYPGQVAPASTVSHWNGAWWSDIYEGPVSGVWAEGPDSIFLVGTEGIRSPHAAIPIPFAEFPATCLWGGGGDLFAMDPDFGQVGYAAKGSSTLTFLPTAPARGPVHPPTSIWASGVSDIWMNDGMPTSSNILHWDGTGWATSGTISDPALTPVTLGGSGPNDVWAVSNLAVHWDGKAWSQPEHSDVSYRAVWASSPQDAYEVGPGGSIRHWDGTSWAAMTSGTTADLNDVWGTGPDDVYVVGAAGTTLHLEQRTRWSLERQTVVADLVHVRWSGPGNMFATDGKVLFHRRGGAWEPVQTPVGVEALWVEPTSTYVSGRLSGMSPGIYRLDLLGVTCQTPESDCTDGWDNDGDGLQDAADPDCAGTKATEQCANLADDDGDGLVDCADPDCIQFPSCRKR